MADGQAAPADRQLNVTDALSYLDAVKVQFHSRPDVYNVFLDIMKDFKSQVIDTPGVIQRVSNLFHGHPSLIQGFNTFLPVGYRIDVGASSQMITVTTPSGTVMQSTTDMLGLPPPPPNEGSSPPMSTTEFGAPPRASSALGLPSKARTSSPDLVALEDADRQNLGPAMDYVQRIKTRFSDDPDTYKKFLEILSSHKSTANNKSEVYAKVEELFKDAPELSSAFREFLPSGGMGDDADDGNAIRGMLQGRTATPTMSEHLRAPKRKQPEQGAAPAKRRRKAPAEKEKEKEREREISRGSGSKPKKTKQLPAEASPFSHYATITAPPSPRRSGHRSHSHHPPPHPPLLPHMTYHQPPPSSVNPNLPPGPMPGADETQFFTRVKQALVSREAYNEFLKLVNLFTQDFIDRARLVRESKSFLGETELMVQFKEILGWDEGLERAALAREREEAFLPPGRPMTILDRPSKEELNIRHGSYRRLPVEYINVKCGGRDEMCKSVLNDEWISHPAFASEDSVFMAHKKNIYEEALHRSEEERHEYDFHIDAIVKTITMLEPIANKIALMSHEERVNFKLKSSFGGPGKSVHQRIVKKIYGRDAGLEVIQAMQETPALAVPVVLTRLKQKEEEWKRAQGEWNKVWREVDAQNYYKALDHQSITFRAADKKALTTKAFVSQIEAVMEEQMAKRAILIDPLFARSRPQHQLEFVLEDMDVLKDAVKLSFSYLARLAGTQMRLDNARKNWIEVRLYNIVRSFFMLEDGWAAPGDAKTAAAMFVGKRPKKANGSDARANGTSEDGTSVGDETDASGLPSTSRGSNGRNLTGNFAGDLRKNLLKSEQAKSARAQVRPAHATATPSPMSSRMASPSPAPLQIDEEMPDAVQEQPQTPESPTERRPSRRRSFFTSTWFYTLLRLIEASGHVLYSRLNLFKKIAAERMNDPPLSTNANPVAKHLNLALSSDGLEEVTITAAQYYEFMLESCEKLFDNQIEQGTFEDQMRHMFGLKDAYKIFTIDKVVATVIRQVQGWEQDSKLDKLVKVLFDERHLDNPSVEDHRKLRRQAEEIMGPEENLFRIDWLPDSKVMTCQLLSKDGSSLDDAEVLSGRWQSYIESFVSEAETHGIPPAKVRRPFLRRSLPNPTPDTPPLVVARGGLEIKVCVRTYRLFFVSHTEEILWRKIRPGEQERAEAILQSRNAQRRQWLDKFKPGVPPSQPAD
ncbi:hypothetical protein BV25DRAFT_1803353 [Artomyces pyxidatus]|uniref:Uncharacterized protein n=1 Tax=Artomyces pyxidatus TaxID=48021 RepID=A0ACB8T3P7_9AGAM|nr:hypothetical protein BV25DRAFT_1803353 [Artomyces pyxidatus]